MNSWASSIMKRTFGVRLKLFFLLRKTRLMTSAVWALASSASGRLMTKTRGESAVATEAINLLASLHWELCEDDFPVVEELAYPLLELWDEPCECLRADVALEVLGGLLLGPRERVCEEDLAGIFVEHIEDVDAVLRGDVEYHYLQVGDDLEGLPDDRGGKVRLTGACVVAEDS